MKIIVLGDIHGRGLWKRIVESGFDMVIFIGDYFDSFDIGPELQMENFKDICAFRDSEDGKVITLIGNHDFHYMKEANNETYSGFNSAFASSIGYLLGNEKGKMKLCHREGQYIFTHAGVTKTWCEDNDIIPDNTLPDQINNLFKTSPEAFRFNGLDDTGDDIEQGPLWIRPRSLYQDAVNGFIQVVGHTSVKSIQPAPDTGMWLIDAIAHGQYIEINDGDVEVKQVEVYKKYKKRSYPYPPLD